MELLAPAGGFSQLEAAIKFGADAVYLAADRFGMRARATNFSLSDIPRAVEIAHAAGVSVHVTCNILMSDSDLETLPEYLRALDAAGVDALIISDLGALRLARQYAPHCEYHVSTQASVSNVQAALAWYEMGARRVVCAREMSLAEIAALKAALPADMKVETFAHGSMCMAVSGRCLISSYLTGRSGNRGHCTQPCRWMYTLEEEKRPGQHFPIEEDETGTFIMNAQDMNMLAHVREMEAAGIDSIKIEGRNKKAFYVATIVNAYRQVLDGADPADFEEELDTVSHRPYSTGFFFGPAHQSVETDGYEQTCLHVADIVSCEPAGGADVVATNVAGGEAPVGVGAAVGLAGTSAAAGVAAGTAGASLSESAAGKWLITAVCHNRFAEGDALEALVPHIPPVHVTVSRLTWISENAAGEPMPVSVEVANRAMARYTFLSDAPLEPGGFLRLREHRVTSRYA